MDDSSSDHQEGAGHPEAVADGSADPVTSEYTRTQPSPPDTRAEELTERAATETERTVQRGVGIGDPRQVVETSVGEKRLGLCVGPLVDQHDLGADGLDRITPFGEIRDGLAAKRATEVA